MVTLKEQLQSDLNDAMRARDDVRRSTIRMLIAAVKNAEIASQHQLNDDEVVAVARQQARQRGDSIAEFTKAGRQDLVDRESAELVILETYLPQLAGREEVEAAAREVIATTGASGPREIGKVMPALVKKFGSRADGRLMSEVVRELLGG
jgi:uncharacterized protein YqeY